MTVYSDQQEEGFCYSVLDGILDPIIVIDQDYSVVYANRAVRDQAEVRAGGQKCYALLQGRESPCHPCPCQDAFKTGKPYRIIRKQEGKQGHPHLKEVQAYPILNREGGAVRVIELIQNISRAEEEPLTNSLGNVAQGNERRNLPLRPILMERPPEAATREGFVLCDEGPIFFCGMVSGSEKMKALFQKIRLVAPGNATVLIDGETGTEKDLVAHAIHQSSPRRNGPFISIGCGMFSEMLLESELFGHVKGAFTGSIQSKKGLFEEAEGGTLFLDEIADAGLTFQSRLLRFLHEGEIRPVGGERRVKVDVRVVAATSKPLKEAIAKKTFREDLYHRLAMMPMTIPPLRERPDDVLFLAKHFVQKYAIQNGKGPMFLSDNTMKVLLKEPWHGNVRELKNVIERSVILSPGAEITPESLLIGEEGFSANPASSSVSLSVLAHEILSKVERERDRIIDALLRSKGNKASAARTLGISRPSLYNKLKRYRI